MHSAAQVDALRAGIIELALLREQPDGQDFATEVVVREPLVAMLHARHPLATGSEVPIQRLADQPFILFPRRVAPTLHDQIVLACREAGFAPRVEHEALEWHTITGLVSANLGVSLAPEGVKSLRWRGVAYRRVMPAGLRTAILLCSRRASHSPAADMFVRLVRRAVGRGD
jgi:DNA-binding transcriptional LysR family regulator